MKFMKDFYEELQKENEKHESERYHQTVLVISPPEDTDNSNCNNPSDAAETNQNPITIAIPSASVPAQLAAKPMLFPSAPRNVPSPAPLSASPLKMRSASPNPGIQSQAIPTGKVALVFTDIQDSTKIWEHDVKIAADSVKLHNSLIRNCIEECNGYEVKTVC